MMRVCMLSVLLVFAVLSNAASAQDAGTTAVAEVSSTSAYVGDQVTYQVVVRGDRPSGRPSVSFPASVRAQDAGVSEGSRQYMQIINGRREWTHESSITFQYRLQAIEPGTVMVPPAIVTMPDGRQIRTEPVRIEVLLPRLGSGDDLRVELDRTRVYLGETVTARVVWEIDDPAGVGRINFDSSVFDPSFTVEPAPPPGSQGLKEFVFLGQRAVASLEQTFGGNSGQRIRFSFQIRITPGRAGRYEIGPVRVVYDRDHPGRATERLYSESDAITLDVRPVPIAGRPDGYTGLIGSYELRTLASPTTVNVGDPITLRAELRGREPMGDAVNMPDLSGVEGYAQFRLSSEGWREELPRTNGRRVFSTTVRALSADVSQIPPVVLYTFDPATERFERVASAPIQIEVRSVREATLADALMAPGSGAPATGPRGVIGAGDPAFWAAPTPAEVEASRPFRAWEVIREPFVVVAIASGPGAIVAAGVFVFATRRRARPERVRDRALRHAEHLVLRRGPAAGVRAATAAVLDCDPDAVTTADLERLPVHPGLVRTLAEALHASEAPGAMVGKSPDPGDTRLAIRSVRRAIRRDGSVPILHRNAGGGS